MYMDGTRLSRRAKISWGLLRLAAAMAPLFCGTLSAYSGGPPPRYSGAPGDDPASCTACHGGLPINGGAGSVRIVLPNGNFYTPGVTQHILVQVSDAQQRRWGFQMSARLKSDLMSGQAGDFKSTDSLTQVMCDSGAPKPCPDKALVQFIEHTVAGTRPGTPGGATFEFDWTPPAADSGNIVLYAAANAANGNANELGDHIYNTSVEITAAVSSTKPPSPSAIPISQYTVQNMVSDIPGFANQTDLNLTNPWGIALNPSGPLWISNNRSGTSTLYNGLGQPFPVANALVVRIPTGAPTAQVFNNTPAFEIAPGNPALFLFATESGTISGWNPAVDAGNAKVMVDSSSSGAVYKGLALSVTASGPLLYAANFHAGTIDVFDSAYQPASVAGGFVDPGIPAGFAPFNIQKIGRNLYVTYAQQDSAQRADVSGPGNGIINVFDLDGKLLRRLVSNGALNSPWGMALAPAFFGDYGNTLLVANFGDGSINAFDPFTGNFLGTLQDEKGSAIQISGLRGLQFGNGHSGGDANTLYFAAGIANGGNVGDHGLLGSIQVAQ